jgi:hypothetical protein
MWMNARRIFPRISGIRTMSSRIGLRIKLVCWILSFSTIPHSCHVFRLLLFFLGSNSLVLLFSAPVLPLFVLGSLGHTLLRWRCTSLPLSGLQLVGPTIQSGRAERAIRETVCFPDSWETQPYQFLVCERQRECVEKESIPTLRLVCVGKGSGLGRSTEDAMGTMMSCSFYLIYLSLQCNRDFVIMTRIF